VLDTLETIELNTIGTNGNILMKYPAGGVAEAAKPEPARPRHWNRGGPPVQIPVEDPINVGKNDCTELTELLKVAEPLLTPFINQEINSPSETARSTDRSVPRLVSNGWTSNVNALPQLRPIEGKHIIVVVTE
jgi:hypothetical protein